MTRAIPLITLGIAIDKLEIPKTILVYPFQFDHIPKQTMTAKITQIGTTITATIKLAVKEWVNEGFKKSVR